MKKQTLTMFLDSNPGIHAERLNSGALQIESRNPELWHLADWAVSSAVGDCVVLVRKECGFYSARVVAGATGDRWSVCQSYTGRYLTRSGQWSNAGEAAMFYSKGEADKFALQFPQLLPVSKTEATVPA